MATVTRLHICFQLDGKEFKVFGWALLNEMFVNKVDRAIFSELIWQLYVKIAEIRDEAVMPQESPSD